MGRIITEAREVSVIFWPTLILETKRLRLRSIGTCPTKSNRQLLGKEKTQFVWLRRQSGRGGAAGGGTERSTDVPLISFCEKKRKEMHLSL